jgi:hypothetical protein
MSPPATVPRGRTERRQELPTLCARVAACEDQGAGPLVRAACGVQRISGGEQRLVVTHIEGGGALDSAGSRTTNLARSR